MDEKEPTIAEEAGLPDSWKPVDSAPIIPSSAPAPNSRANLFGGSISPTLQHDFIFSQTKYGTPVIPSLPLMPLSASGQPTVGAAIHSGSTTTINNNVSAVAAGPNGAVQFNSGGALTGNSLFIWNNIGNILVIGAGASIQGSLIVVGTSSASVFNASVGYQIGSTAVSGKYLRGNGTDFVSSTLSGTDVLTGLVGVTYGGTGANLSATGGANEVVQQTSVGGAFTVGQLSAASLSNGTTGSGSIVLATAPTINGLTFPTAAGSAAVAQLIASGTAVLGTSPISSTSSATAVTVLAAGVTTTDSIEWSFNAAPVTGYVSGLFVQAYVTAGNVNFVVTNPTAGSLTPAAATLNWRVVR